MTKGEARRLLIRISKTKEVSDEDARLLKITAEAICYDEAESCSPEDALYCDVFECPDEG